MDKVPLPTQVPNVRLKWTGDEETAVRISVRDAEKKEVKPGDTFEVTYIRAQELQKYSSKFVFVSFVSEEKADKKTKSNDQK